MRRLYNPTIEKPDDLKKTLIARGPILNDLLKKIRSSSDDRGLKHYLIIGPRGIGKTHLLLVLHYTVKGYYKDKSLAKSWISIKTYEEEYRITTLSDLLSRVLEELKEEEGLDEVDSILERLRGRSDEEIVELALGFLREFRKKTGKRILLLIEDLGTIFEQIGDEAAIGRIRDILMREDIFMLIGTALSLFKEVVGHGKPFYNFFEVIWLPELKNKEVEELIKKRAKVLGEEKIIKRFEEYRPRIKAIVHLTGGYPRLILMLFHIFTKSELIEVQEALEELLDELTPYFQDRMNRLPPQQRKILDTLILMEGPATPTEIAKEARLDVRIVNPQIRRLTELGYIQVSRQKRRKTTRYEVTERLFRIWREMRTTKGRKRIGFLVKFLKIWYTPIKSFNKALELKPDFETAWCRKGVALEAMGKYEEALKSFNKALELKPKCFWLQLHRVDVLSSLKRHGEAFEELEKFLLVIKDKQDEESIEVKKTAGILGSNICLSLSQDSALQKNYGAAEDYLKKALTYGEIGDSEELQKLIVGFLKELIFKDQIEFAQQVLQVIGEAKGSDFTELLRPFSIALDYIRTQDPNILEKLHEEVRQVVEEIIQKTERGKGVQGAESP